jgi:uncharacterized membrane protein
MKQLLWLLVLLAATGDIVTTVHGLEHRNNVEESNPIAQEMADEFGVGGAMLLLKTVVIAGAYLLSRAMESWWVPPAALASVWSVVTAWNILLLT